MDYPARTEKRSDGASPGRHHRRLDRTGGRGAVRITRHQLADLGARVIKIERPDGGDFGRDPGRHDRPTACRGCLDVAEYARRRSLDAGPEIRPRQPGPICPTRLIRARRRDAVQNLAPGAADRIGLSGPTLRARHPRLIVCNVTKGYRISPGRSTPPKKAYDLARAGRERVRSPPTRDAGRAEPRWGMVDRGHRRRDVHYARHPPRRCFARASTHDGATIGCRCSTRSVNG